MEKLNKLFIKKSDKLEKVFQFLKSDDGMTYNSIDYGDLICEHSKNDENEIILSHKSYKTDGIIILNACLKRINENEFYIESIGITNNIELITYASPDLFNRNPKIHDILIKDINKLVEMLDAILLEEVS